MKTIALVMLLTSTAVASPGDEPPPPEETVVAKPVVTAAATPPPFVASAVVVEEPPKLGRTIEFGVGYGQWRGFGDSLGGFAGPSMSVGGFIAPQVALSLRMAGVGIASEGIGWIGVIGPHAQLWATDQIWVGFGAGAAVGFACGGGGCFDDMTAGFDGRLGFATRPRGESGASFSVEMTTFHGLKTFSLLLGYQSF